MTTTMQLIAKQTVGADGASSITFSNIPQTYTDLKIVASVRGTTAQVYDVMSMQINGTSTFNWKKLEGSGSGASSASGTTNDNIAVMTGANATASTFGSADIYIPNYTVTGNKSISVDSVSENNATTAYADFYASIWTGTAAVTSISFTPQTSPFVEFSTFYLYGISNSTTVQATTVPFASGGDIITNDGTYWYHTFLYSGTFTPLKNLTCDYLVVAGGGGGGYPSGNSGNGGGGAGGARYFSETPFLSSTGYTVTIGAGGSQNNNGVNSSLIGDVISTSSTGGGYGGAQRSGGLTPGNGGSGGGGCENSTAYGTGNAGSYTPVEGYNGGAANLNYPGSGGGGAGGAGQNAPSGGATGTAGSGGVGITSTALDAFGVATLTGQLSSGHYYYAGGGGGGHGAPSGGTVGSGGLGGGGIGGAGNNTYAGSGTANTGGGGGGSGDASRGAGSGGSGIVIVRYAV